MAAETPDTDGDGSGNGLDADTVDGQDAGDIGGGATLVESGTASGNSNYTTSLAEDDCS